MNDRPKMANLTKMSQEGKGGTPVAVNPLVDMLLLSRSWKQCVLYAKLGNRNRKEVNIGRDSTRSAERFTPRETGHHQGFL